MNFWLMKTEPTVFSMDDLKRDKKTYWDGVRNFQARNFLRDTMKVGDLALYYYSNAEPSGVAGIAKVCRAGYPDFTSWDKKDIHYDVKSTKVEPTWFMVDVEFVEKFPHFVSLEELKSYSDLKGMMVLKRGMRLSVQPVEKKHFEIVRNLGQS